MWVRKPSSSSTFHCYHHHCLARAYHLLLSMLDQLLVFLLPVRFLSHFSYLALQLLHNLIRVKWCYKAVHLTSISFSIRSLNWLICWISRCSTEDNDVLGVTDGHAWSVFSSSVLVDLLPNNPVGNGSTSVMMINTSPLHNQLARKITALSHWRSQKVFVYKMTRYINFLRFLTYF